VLAWDSFAAYYWESSSTVISHDRLAEKRLARYQRSGRDDDWNILPAFELGFLIRQLPQQLNGAAFQLTQDHDPGAPDTATPEASGQTRPRTPPASWSSRWHARE
jgi:hypothetical protein